MVRNLIVCWTLSTEIREILLSEGGTLGLSKAIEIARAHETTQAQLSTMGDVSKDMKFKQEIGALQKTNVVCVTNDICSVQISIVHKYIYIFLGDFLGSEHARNTAVIF